MTLEDAWSEVSGTKQWVVKHHTSQWLTRSIASYLFVVQHSWSEKNDNVWLAVCSSVMWNNKGAEIISLQKLLVWLGKHEKKRQVVKNKDGEKSMWEIQWWNTKVHAPYSFKQQTWNTKVGIKFWFKLVYWTFFESGKLYFLPSSIPWAKIGHFYVGNPNTNFIWETAIRALTTKCYDYTSVSYIIYLRTNLKQQGFLLCFLFFSVKRVIPTHVNIHKSM